MKKIINLIFVFIILSFNSFAAEQIEIRKDSNYVVNIPQNENIVVNINQDIIITDVNDMEYQVITESEDITVQSANITTSYSAVKDNRNIETTKQDTNLDVTLGISTIPPVNINASLSKVFGEQDVVNVGIKKKKKNQAKYLN